MPSPSTTLCDTPEGEPLSAVPGRSGTEFIARLQELEHFAEQSPLLQPDHYTEGPVDFDLQKEPKEENFRVFNARKSAEVDRQIGNRR